MAEYCLSVDAERISAPYTLCVVCPSGYPHLSNLPSGCGRRVAAIRGRVEWPDSGRLHFQVIKSQCITEFASCSGCRSLSARAKAPCRWCALQNKSSRSRATFPHVVQSPPSVFFMLRNSCKNREQFTINALGIRSRTTLQCFSRPLRIPADTGRRLCSGPNASQTRACCQMGD